MSIFFWWVLPYIVLIVFLVGLIHRMLVWAHVPVPFKLTVFPSPNTTAGAVGDVLKEVVGFRSLWRGKKGLWFAAWLFHISLAFVLVGHFFGITFLGHQFTILGVTPDQSEHLSVLFGTYAGLCLSLGLVILTVRRIGSARMRYISHFADYLVLILLLGIVGTGMYMRFFDEVAYSGVRDFLVGLLTLHPVLPPANTVFMFHFTLVELLLLYFPSSKLMHACGFFFTRWLITRPYERQVILK